MPSSRRIVVAGLAAVFLALPGTAHAQTAAERASVLAIADSALAMITKGDVIALTDLMVPEAVMFPTGERGGVSRYVARTREQQRNTPFGAKIDERGWNPEVKVQGAIAMVWYPYDLYVDGKWSHCGIDLFSLVKHEGAWRIASMSWTAEQPPACAKHPAGPPKR